MVLVSFAVITTHEEPMLTTNRDKVGDKPWLNEATNARWTFWDAAKDWLPTWGEGDKRGMTIKSVKMWQQGKCGATKEL